MDIAKLAETLEEMLGSNDSINVNYSQIPPEALTSNNKIELLSKYFILVQRPTNGSNTILLKRVNQNNSSKIANSYATNKNAPTPQKKKIEIPDPNVPFSDYYPPAVLGDIKTILLSKKTSNIWTFGPTQCGKSRGIRYVAHNLGRKLHSICCKEDMSSKDFFGYNTIKGTEIVFIKGVVEQSMTEGLNDKGEVIGPAGILFIDEAASMPSGIAIGLNNTLETADNRRTLILPEDGGRVVRSHPDWRVIFAGNTNGAGATDMASQAYTAQQCALDASLLQRMTATFRFGYDRRAEERIVRLACQEEKDDMMCNYFLEFKQAIRDILKRGNGELNTPFSTKKVIDIMDMYNTFKVQLKGNENVIRKTAMTKAMYYSAYEMLTSEERTKYDETWYALTKERIGSFSPAMSTSSEIDYM